MHKPRYFLLLAVAVLGLGCFLAIAPSATQPDEWRMYLGMTCIILSLCVAALIEAIQAQSKRIGELERKLADRPAPPTSPGER